MDRKANWVIGLSQVVLAVIAILTAVIIGVTGIALAVIAGMTVVLFGVGGFMFFNSRAMEQRATEGVGRIDGLVDRAESRVKELESSLRNEIREKVANALDQIKKSTLGIQETEERFRQKEKDFDARLRRADDRMKSGGKLDKDERRTVRQAVKDKNASMLVGLRANALKYEDEEKWDKALTMWETLVTFQPDNSRAFFGMMFCLGRLATQEEDHLKKRRLLVEAEQAALKAQELEPSEETLFYNLACIAALQEDGKKCREWLEKAESVPDLLTVAHMEKDSDLDLVREEEWFKELLERQRAREAAAGGEDGKA